MKGLRKEQRQTFVGGFAPVFLSPHTLVRTWGTPQELVGEEWILRTLVVQSWFE
jgi:hypothetical protein